MPTPPIIQPGIITPYLACSPVIACTHPAIRSLARDLIRDTIEEPDQINNLYTYVRDSITHTIDGGYSELFWIPDTIISAGHALCFGKSHLLTALCRAVGIPAGLCYQRVRKEDGSFVLHGLNAVLLEEKNQWIRLDARGNKQGIEAEFNPSGEEKLVYPHNDAPGEWFDPHIYAEPWDTVISLFETSEDAVAFIDASARIQAPTRHPPKVPILTPVPV